MEATASTRRPSAWYATQPVFGRGGEKAAHLVAPVVEDQALPVGVEAQTRVFVFEEMRAVEHRQCVRVGGEVGGHPVEDHPYSGEVQLLDECHEILGRAVAAGGREVTGGLVSPGPVEGMLHEGQELHVGESAALYVLDERPRDLAVVRRDFPDPRRRVANSPGGLRRPRSAPRESCGRRGCPSTRRRASRSRGSQITDPVLGDSSKQAAKGSDFSSTTPLDVVSWYL